MFFNTTLQAVSAWITYCVQIALTYVLAWGVCGLISSPRLRLRVWGVFFLLAALGWFVFCIPGSPASSLPLTNGVVQLPRSGALHGSWTIQASWLPRVDWIAGWAWRIYFSVLIFFFLLFVWKTLELRAFLRSGEQPPTELCFLFQRLCRQMKVSRCKLVLLADLRSPATTGWLRPQILLPTELVPQLQGNQLIDVLRHELTHVRRHDYLWDRLASLVCRIVFFHPAIWLAHRRLRQDRELACDLAVVRNRRELRLRYAECLAKLARWWFQGKENSSHTIAFASSSSLLATRVRALLREPSPRSGFHRAARGALITILTGLAVCFLPSIGVRFHWPELAGSAGQPVVEGGSSGHGALRTKRSRPVTAKTGTSAVASQTEISSKSPETASAPPGLFAGLNSVALPVLVPPSATPDMAKAGSRREWSGPDRSEGSRGQGVWDEPGAPRPMARRPDWSSLAVGAVATGVALATDRGGNGQDGERTDH